jgi:hypothetical protein
MKRIHSTFFLLLAIPAYFASPNVNADEGRKPRAPAALTVPIAGTSQGAALSGTFTINRFVMQNHELMAVGIVRGTLTGVSGQVLRTGMADLALPVTTMDRRTASFTRPAAAPQLVPAVLREPAGGRFILAQAQSCGVLHLDIGGNTIDLLGFTVSLTPITLDISGDSAGPLGSLVCQVIALLGTTADVVGLLNNLLGALTGLVGGLTGGL